MSTAVMRRTRNPWRNEEVTIRFMKDDERGVSPAGVGSVLIESA